MTVRQLLALAGAGAAVAAAIAVSASAAGSTIADWKGGDSLMLTGLTPDPTRCGTPSLQTPIFEARFSGTGIDTAAGAFAVTASACVDLATLRVSDLEATDRFTAGFARGDTITIESDDFRFERNDASGVVYSERPVRFRVTDATGTLSGAEGHGDYEIALSWPPSGGVPQPAHIWFAGELRLP